MNSDDGPAAIEQLSHSECWALLRKAKTGRVAVTHDGTPDIFPVNHVVDHASIVYRTGTGALFRATLHHDVAFEVDGQDLETTQAWSVVVRGRATERLKITEILDSLDLPIAPWQSGAKPRYVHIEPREVTGRRFTIAKRVQAQSTD